MRVSWLLVWVLAVTGGVLPSRLGASEPPERDLAVAGVVAPVRVDLDSATASVEKTVAVLLENRGGRTEKIPDASSFSGLVALRAVKKDGSGELQVSLQPRDHYPITLEPGETLAFFFTVEFNRRLATELPQFGVGHAEIRYQVAVHGAADAVPANDSFPTLDMLAADEDEEQGCCLPLVIQPKKPVTYLVAFPLESTPAGLLPSPAEESTPAQASSDPRVEASQPATRAAGGACVLKSIAAKPTAVLLKQGAPLSEPSTVTAVFPASRTCVVSWSPGDAAKFTDLGKPAVTFWWNATGDHVVSAYVFDIRNPGNHTHGTVTIKVLQASFEDVEGKKIGVTTANKDRSQTFHAKAQPASAASEVQIRVSKGASTLKVKGTPMPQGDGTIIFELEGTGTTGSAAPGDCTVEAVVGGKVADKATVTVIIPKFLTGQVNEGRQDRNYLAFEGNGRMPGSSPAFVPGPGEPHVVYPMVRLKTIYGFGVRLTVADQFRNPIGDPHLYLGAPVSEDFGTGRVGGINQSIQANSTYFDPVGVPGLDPNPSRRPVRFDSPLANAWVGGPAHFLPPFQNSRVIESSFTAVVDGFPLQPRIFRRLSVFAPSPSAPNGTVTLFQTP